MGGVDPRVEKEIDRGPAAASLDPERLKGLTDVVRAIEVTWKATLFLAACGARQCERIMTTNRVLANCQ